MRKLAGPLIKALVFVLVTGFATAVLAMSISNTDLGDRVGYAARFTDVTSLNPGDDVRVSGVRVGQVDEHVHRGRTRRARQLLGGPHSCGCPAT